MKKRIIVTVSMLGILILSLSFGALAAVTTDRMNSITPDLESYQEIKNRVDSCLKELD